MIELTADLQPLPNLVAGDRGRSVVVERAAHLAEVEPFVLQSRLRLADVVIGSRCGSYKEDDGNERQVRASSHWQSDVAGRLHARIRARPDIPGVGFRESRAKDEHGQTKQDAGNMSCLRRRRSAARLSVLGMRC